MTKRACKASHEIVPFASQQIDEWQQFSTDDLRKKDYEIYGHWRIKTNQEINDILKGQTIIGLTKKQRVNWLGHVERMAEDNIVHRIKIWKPMSRRPIGRPKTRWEDDVLEDIKSMNVGNWKNIEQKRLEESR